MQELRVSCQNKPNKILVHAFNFIWFRYHNVFTLIQNGAPTVLTKKLLHWLTVCKRLNLKS